MMLFRPNYCLRIGSNDPTDSAVQSTKLETWMLHELYAGNEWFVVKEPTNFFSKLQTAKLIFDG